MYLRRRQWCHIACGSAAVQAVLKFDQFYRSSVFKPSLDLLPCKCAYAKVIDLRNMVLWSIRFIAKQYRIPPHQISLCPLLVFM